MGYSYKASYVPDRVKPLDYMTLCAIRRLRKCDDMWYSIVHGERTLCGIGN